MTEEPEIILKWGTLKGWRNMTEAGMQLLARYRELGASLGCMQQKDDSEQRQILIDLVSLPDMKIFLDWDGKYITKDEAVKYLSEYER